MAKPRKKYNANAALMRESDRVCKNSLIFSALGLPREGQLWIKNGVIVPYNQVNKRDFHLTYEVSRPWTFIFGAACRTQLGEFYIKVEEVHTRTRNALLSDEMNTFINSEVDRITKSINRQHLLSPFFIAAPEEREISDAEIERYLIAVGVQSKCKTAFEIDDLRERAHQVFSSQKLVDYVDPATAGILRKNKIESFLDLVLSSERKILEIKGLGIKRLTAIRDSFSAMLANPTLQDKLRPWREYEAQFDRVVRINEIYGRRA